MRIKVLAAALLLSWASVSFAQGAPSTPPPPQFKFELHGFTTGTIYAQDANLSVGGGQGALFVNPQTSAANRAPNQDKLYLGADVRQTRLNFSLAGPTVFGGATPKGVVEIDFFGQFGSGAYGDVSLSPRMRLAYAELNWGAHRLQFGQQNDLIIGMIPVSLAHIAFPVSYGSGTVGWRHPGIWGYHTFGNLADKDATKVEFAWMVGRSQWNDSGSNTTSFNCGAPVAGAPAGTVASCSGVATVGNGIGQSVVGASGDAYGNSFGAASGLPAVEARLTLLGGQNYSAWISGHWQTNDRSGANNGPTTTNGISSDIQTIIGVVGAKAAVGPLTLAATAYAGKNTGPEIGEFLQFPRNTAGDVHEWGGWAQAGFNFTKELSVWGYIGTEQPNRNEARDAGMLVLGQTTSGALLQYRDGGYAVGFEWFHFRTVTVAPAGFDTTLDGNQYMLSGNYFF